MSYKRLSLKVRHYIEVEWKKGVSKKQIAEFLGRDPGILSRELKSRELKSRELKPRELEQSTRLSESTDQLQWRSNRTDIDK